jgi:hypothetical protein
MPHRLHQVLVGEDGALEASVTTPVEQAPDAHGLLTGRADTGRNSLGRLPVGASQRPSR